MFTPLQQVHIWIQEMSKSRTFIPAYMLIKHFKGDPDIIKHIEQLVTMNVLDDVYFKIGEIKLTPAGMWTVLPPLAR